MGSMQWQLGREMGTIPAFASRTQENQENLGIVLTSRRSVLVRAVHTSQGSNEEGHNKFCFVDIIV